MNTPHITGGAEPGQYGNHYRHRHLGWHQPGAAQKLVFFAIWYLGNQKCSYRAYLNIEPKHMGVYAHAYRVYMGNGYRSDRYQIALGLGLGLS